ncbi:MAG: molybdopterin-dependent oxidoreductase [Firmicutes bacterium]|nr:molybdopterin-dependent oxidoreductase [Bacillota bacterium]
MSETKVITTTCRLCPVGCGMNVHVKDNKVLKVRGLPEDPRTKGRLCAKGSRVLDILYAPDRLLNPLRRKGERGAGHWEEISWAEALDEIHSKIVGYKEEFGARSISLFRGQASDWGATWLYAFRFMNALGSPNTSVTSHLCYTPRAVAHTLSYGGYAEPDYANTDCILVWGANPTNSHERAPFGAQMFSAKKRGAKLIVIDPLYTKMAANADIWLQIKPGTDMALALGMLKIIIDEDLYAHEYVEKWTVGFEELKKHVQDYPLDKVAAITELPAEKIEEVARLYATTRKACIFDGNGLDQQIGVIQTVRSLCILRAITGHIEVKGSDCFPDTLSLKSRDLKLLENLPQDIEPIGGRTLWYNMTGNIPMPALADTILTGRPYPVKAIIVQGGNPVVTMANTPRMIEALKKIEFSVVMDVFMTRTAQLADIVLPAANFLEYTNLTGYPGMRTNFPTVQQQTVEPRGQAWPDWKLWFELGKRISPTHFPWRTVEEAIDYQLEPTGFGVKQLKGHIVVIPKRYEKFKSNGFFTPSKKIELYSQRMLDFGHDPLPVFKNPYECPERTPNEEYPFSGINWTISDYYMHSQHRNIPSLRERDPEPLVYLNPEDARKKGIAEGDMVKITSPHGSIEQRCKIADKLTPGYVAISWGWGDIMPEAGANELIGDSLRDEISETTSNRLFICNIEKKS